MHACCGLGIWTFWPASTTAPVPQTDASVCPCCWFYSILRLQCSTALTGKRITSGFCSEAEAAENGYDPVSASA